MSREQYEAFFRKMDKSGNGVVSKEEMYGVMGPEMKYDQEAMEKYFRAADLSNDGEVTMEEFLTAMDALPGVDHKKAAFRRAFNEFDTDGSGNIDANELRKVLGSVGEDCSDAQMERLRKIYDTDADGKVDYEEFITKFFNQ